MRFDILSCPIRIVIGVIFAHAAALAEIVRHFKKNIHQFEMIFPLCLDGIIAIDRAKNVARDRAGGVAVAVVVHSCDDTSREIMLVAQRIINCEMPGGWLLCAYVHPTCILYSKTAEKRSPLPREDCTYLLDPGAVHDGPPKRTHSIGDSIQRNRTSKEKRDRCDPQWKTIGTILTKEPVFVTI